MQLEIFKEPGWGLVGTEALTEALKVMWSGTRGQVPAILVVLLLRKKRLRGILVQMLQSQ